MRSLLPLFLLPILPLLVLGQDKAEKKEIPPIKVVTLDRKEPVLYDKDIEPIFVNKCQGCHSGQIKEARFDLSSYETLIKGGKRGKSFIPGNSKDSLLVKLGGKTEKPHMPPKSEEPLSPEELALIKLWIDQGAKAPTTTRVRPKVIVGVPPGLVNPVRALAISPDKSQVIAGRGNQLHVYEAGSGNHVRSLVQPDLKTPDGKAVQAAHLSIVEALAYSPDGNLVASGSFQELIVWDAKTGAIKHKLTDFADKVVSLAFSNNNQLLAVGGGPASEDGELKIFEVASGKLVVDIKNGHSDTVYGTCFNSDGTKIATCAADKFVKVFEIPSGKFIKSFEGHTHHVLDVGWKSDDKLIVSAGSDSPTAVGPGNASIKFWDYEKGEQITRNIQAGNRQVTRLLFIGKTPQFVTCSGDQAVRIINADNGAVVRTFTGSTDYLYAVGVSPDGALVASGGEEGIVRLYNGTNGQLIRTLLPPGVAAPEPKK